MRGKSPGNSGLYRSPLERVKDRLCYPVWARFARSPARLSASLDPIHALIADDMAAVVALIRRRLDSDVVLVRQVAEYIIASGGKRLRPALVLLAAGACGYRGPHQYELAAVVDRPGCTR